MSLLDSLSAPEAWERFYRYKQSLACPKPFLRELRDFIDQKAYLPVCERIREGRDFPLPSKAVISKQSSSKKRVVYTYPPAENTVLKFLTYLLLRRYDGLFCPELYSFRPGRSAKDAVFHLLRTPDLMQMTAYKADIHDYFNSIPVERLLPSLEAVLAEDPELFAFLKRLLEEPYIRDGERIVREPKGIMAGTPLASFYANLYLREMDEVFHAKGVPYARYSDDIIVFARNSEELAEHARCIRETLSALGLTINPDKEKITTPEEGFTFLGFFCRGGMIDIAPASVDKLKAKMRRKTRALQRWQKRRGQSGEHAATAFIRIFNRKLLEVSGDSDLSWSRWFFSAINTTQSLEVIDRYAQDCLRTLISGTRTKARFNVRYEDLKVLGYQSLVHAYYAFRPKND